jgi:hypothetical protein
MVNREIPPANAISTLSKLDLTPSVVFCTGFVIWFLYYVLKLPILSCNSFPTLINMFARDVGLCTSVVVFLRVCWGPCWSKCPFLLQPRNVGIWPSQRPVLCVLQWSCTYNGMCCVRKQRNSDAMKHYNCTCGKTSLREIYATGHTYTTHVLKLRQVIRGVYTGHITMLFTLSRAVDSSPFERSCCSVLQLLWVVEL